jgi:malonyl-CoA O-methyltransferase
VVALDLAEGMLQFARARVGSSVDTAHHATHWLCGDAENLPLADDSCSRASPSSGARISAPYSPSCSA